MPVARGEGAVSFAKPSKWDWPTRKAIEISSRIVSPLRMP